jgi:hypothetical protein
MFKRYLVAHEDSISMWEPAFVTSTSPTEAVNEYLRQVYSKDSTFREHVRDLCHIDGFTGGLVYSSFEEQMALENGVRNESPELVFQRLKDFFSQAPELGEIFLNYHDTEDADVLSDAVYEYIAVRDPDGFIAIEEDKILALA